MATFTVTVTLTGRVAGRAVNYTHEGTFTGIEEVAQDAGVVTNVAPVTTMKNTGTSQYRGRSNYAGTEFVAIANVTPNQFAEVAITGSSSVQLWAMTGIPVMVWQSHDYDSAFMYDATTPGSPDEDCTSMVMTGLTGPCEFNAIAFYRSIT